MKPWWRRLAQNRLIDVGAAVIVFLSLWKIVVVLPQQAKEFDFAHFYTWSSMLREGRNPYLYLAPDEYTRHGFRFQSETPSATYPPSLLWLFSPLTFLTPRTAFVVWTCVQLAVLAGVLWLTWNLLRDRLSARGMYFVCAGTLASTALYHHFISSQIQLQLTLVLLLGFVWHKSGRDTLACLAIAAAGFVKLFPLVLLPWFVWRGQGRTELRVARGGLAIIALMIGVLWTNTHLWSDFFEQSAPILQHWAQHHLFNYTVPSLVLHIGYVLNHFNAAGEAVLHWWNAGVVIGLGLIATAYLWCLRTSDDASAQFSLLCCAMLAGIPTSWEHYFVILIFPLAEASVRIATRPTGPRVLLIALILVAVNNLSTVDLVFGDLRQWPAILWNYTPVYGVVALGVFFALVLPQRGTVTALAGKTGTESNTPPRP
jgi:hypothetical protein